MLVCNVSLSRRRAAIAAGITEITVALDQPGTGNVVFATLVDDPASVGDHIDAFLGQIIVEAASATATITAGSTYAAAVVEAVTVIELWSGSVPAVLSASIAETVSAADHPDASKVAGAAFNGVLALDGPIPPASTQATVILIEG